MEFRDLVIRIAPWSVDTYKVIVTDSPLGVTGTGAFRIPEELTNYQRAVSLPSRDLHGENGISSGPEPNLAGKMLFKLLFHGAVQQIYERSRGRCERLRIKLVLEDQPRTVAVERLHALPWELLNDGHFLETEADISIVRYLDSLADTDRPPADKLRVLTLGATPVDKPSVGFNDELGSINKVLEGELVEMEYLPKPGYREISLEMLHQTLRRGFHVLHFVGHGEEGSLLFTGSDGTHVHVTGAQLAEEIRALPTRIRPLLVILNACSTAASRLGGEELHVAGSLVKNGIPAVIAMRHPISNHAGITFSTAFYRQLAVGACLDDAMNAGRMAIKRDVLVSDEWATPILFMSLKDGKVFHTPDDSREPSIEQSPMRAEIRRSRGLIADSVILSFFWSLFAPSLKWLSGKLPVLSWQVVALPAALAVSGGVYLGIQSGIFTLPDPEPSPVVVVSTPPTSEEEPVEIEPPVEIETIELVKQETIEPPVPEHPPGLIGWWALDQTDGTRVADQVGNHHGERSPELKPSAVGFTEKSGPEKSFARDALWFDGERDYVMVPNHPDFDFANGFSIEARVWHQEREGLGANTFALVSKLDGGRGFSWYVKSGFLEFQTVGGTGKTFRSNALVQSGEWHHVVLSFDRDHGFSFYLDGQAQGKQVFSGEGNALRTKAPMFIGAVAGERDFWKGAIDEVKLYNRALTLPEIQSLNEGN